MMHSDWRCADCGPVPPLHVAEHINRDIAESAAQEINKSDSYLPLWCPWPLPLGWTVTGIAWVGDERTGVKGTTVAISGPGPLGDGPGDILLVAEEPGLGLGNRFAGIPGLDPGSYLADVMSEAPHAKVRAGGHPTPLWSIKSADDRSAYVGEAKGVWLYAVAWPARAGYLLSEDVVLQDLAEHVPPELVYGAPSPYLHGKA